MSNIKIWPFEKYFDHPFYPKIKIDENRQNLWKWKRSKKINKIDIIDKIDKIDKDQQSRIISHNIPFYLDDGK